MRENEHAIRRNELSDRETDVLNGVTYASDANHIYASVRQRAWHAPRGKVALVTGEKVTVLAYVPQRPRVCASHREEDDAPAMNTR